MEQPRQRIFTNKQLLALVIPMEIVVVIVNYDVRNPLRCLC